MGKKLSIKEKAQRYDEAIKKVTDYRNGVLKLFSNVDQTLRYLFPDIQENRDEMIRKSLIHLVKKSSEQGGYALHKWEAKEMLIWLNNQRTSEESIAYLKEHHSPSEVSDFQAAMNIAVAKAYDSALKKRAQTITANLLEDKVEGIQRELIEFLSNMIDAPWRIVLKSADRSAQKIRDLIEKTDELKTPESVIEFDEEVEKFCKETFITDPDEKGEVFCIARHFTDWQKSRQKALKWDEKDEKMFNRVCDLIHSAAFTAYDVDEDGNELGEYANLRNWVKKFRDLIK